MDGGGGINADCVHCIIPMNGASLILNICAAVHRNSGGLNWDGYQRCILLRNGWRLPIHIQTFLFHLTTNVHVE